MSLLDKFNEMQEEVVAEEFNKVAEAEVQEQEEFLSKYASWAQDVLAEEVGEGNFTAEDVEKLAHAKIEDDANELHQREKVAEAYEMGQIMYQGFKAAAEADSSDEGN